MSNNIFAFQPTDTMTPEQALQLAEHGGPQDCLVVGYDSDGDLFIRSFRMGRKLAQWLAEQLRMYELT